MRARQEGIATVEFAIGGAVFFIILFAVAELGRLLFTWNALAEATRRGVRVAVVCPVNHSDIVRVALFDGPATSGTSPVLKNLNESHFSVSYLDEDGSVIGSPEGDPGFSQIRYVRVATSGYQHSLLIPFLNSTLAAPDFSTTLPRESLGIPRDGVAASCFGTST